MATSTWRPIAKTCIRLHVIVDDIFCTERRFVHRAPFHPSLDCSKSFNIRGEGHAGEEGAPCPCGCD